MALLKPRSNRANADDIPSGTMRAQRSRTRGINRKLSHGLDGSFTFWDPRLLTGRVKPEPNACRLTRRVDSVLNWKRTATMNEKILPGWTPRGSVLIRQTKDLPTESGT